jgi:hypothetical protein
METVKAFAIKHVTEATTNPVSFAFNILGAAVAVWFAAVILNIAVRIGMQSYAIITSAF